jgi:Tol biopolymer transport system component
MGLPNGTYTYRITAVDMADNESEPSNEDSASINIQIPDTPINLHVEGVDVENTLKICWEYSGDPVAGFNLYRSTQPGGPYDIVNDEIIDDTCYDDTDFIDVTEYYYTVSAVDQYGNESIQSNEDSGTPWRIPPESPVIFSPTISGFPLTVGTPEQDILGFAEPSALVELFKNGDSIGTAYSTDSDQLQSLFEHEGSGYIEVDMMFLSPDAQTIAYSGRDYDKNVSFLKLIDVSTGSTTTVMEDSEVDVDEFDWSPDSRKLVFVKFLYQEFKAEVNIYDIDLAITTQVLSEQGTMVGYFDWSPESSKVAYSTYNFSGEERIYVFDFNEGNRPLTEDTDVSEFYSSWSSDSTKIVFSSDRGNGYYDVWIKDLSSGSLTQLSDGLDTANALFSPDDQKIIFIEQGGTLYIGDIATGNILPVDSGLPPGEVNISWSPDGDRFAYISSKNGDYDIYVYNTVDNSIIQITTGGTEPYYYWSPDGQNLVYSIENNTSELWISPSEELTTGRMLYQFEGRYSKIDWAQSGEIYFIDMDGPGYELLKITPQGLFKFPDVLLDDGENEFYATATDGSGEVSLPSEEILLTYDLTLNLPDLEVLDTDIIVYPAIPLMGEETSIYAYVRNKGETAVENLEVIIYVWNSQGELVPVKYEEIPLMGAGAEILIYSTWDSTNSPGENTVIVDIDGYNLIVEVSENNNTAFSEFYVTAEEGIDMTTSLNNNEFIKNEDVYINIDLHNSGTALEGELNVRIEDNNGGIAYVFDPVSVSMPYGHVEDFQFVWNTGSIFAGDYQVRASLSKNDEEIRENLVTFKVLPELLIEADMTTDKTSYNAFDDVILDIKVRNNSGNYIIPHLNLKTSIFRFDDVEVFAAESDLYNILMNSSSDTIETWNTDISPSGTYRAVLEVFSEGEQVLEVNRVFEINPSAQISGTLKAVPEVLFYDNPVRAEYTVTTSGNTPGDLLPVNVLVVDTDTQAVLDSAEETVDLTQGGTASGQFEFNTSALLLKTYKMLLQYGPAGDTRTLATAAFTVKDGTPPVVTILSPEPDSIHCSPFDRNVKVMDNISGVEIVEFRIDSAEEWTPMPAVDPAASEYGSRWVPVAGDEGPHTIYYRATDRAGNVSEPVSVNITIVTSFELLTGTITAEPDPVYQGMEESFIYTINNQAGSDINDMIIRVHVVDPGTAQIVETLEEVETISGNSVYSGTMTFIASLSPVLYDAILEVELSSGSGPRTLNSTDFEVLALNNAPVADAGMNRNVVTGESLTLDGSNSYDPDGGMITFMWTFTEVPAGSTVTDDALSDVTSVMPTFTPDIDGTYVLELVVDDGELNGTDDVALFASTPNVAPNADAGPDQNALTGTMVQLDGSGSADPDNSPDPLSFEWTFDELPGQSLLTDNDINSRDHANASFTPDVDGNYRVKLSVSDGDSFSDDTAQINAASTGVPPNADAGDDFTIALDDSAMLDGSGSYDPDESPEALSYAWQFVTVPEGSTLTSGAINDSDTAYGYFIPDVTGIYVLALTVGDGLSYDTDHVAVKVVPAPTQTVFDLYARGKRGKIQIVWTPVEGAECYNVYRGTSSGSYTRIVDCHDTYYATYLDLDVINDTTYYYVVTSVEYGIESLYSNEAEGMAPSTRRQ